MSEPYKQWFEADKDGSGRISFTEFCQWAIQRSIDLIDSKNEKNNTEDSEID